MNDHNETHVGGGHKSLSTIGNLKLGRDKERSASDPVKWGPKRLDPHMFPDPPRSGNSPPSTFANVAYMLQANGVVARYNVIKKRTEIAVPGLGTTLDNADNVTMTHIISLAALNGMRTDLVPSMVEAIGDQGAYNPVGDWIKSRPWDGKDRLGAFYDTLTAREGYPEKLKQALMGKWMISAVAAALSEGDFRCRGVLTLQGPQGLGKTSWGKSLIDDPLLANSVIKTDHHLDGGNKDSLLGAITHFIVEIGELESSFKRDVSRLKGFLTADSDKVRRPYARIDSEYPRRTVFYATVNGTDFLIDNTGNTRWWTIPVIAINYNHSIDMQQLFAQLAVDYAKGRSWWLSPAEEALLEEQNEKHKSVSVVRERLLEVISPFASEEYESKSVTASEALLLAGIEKPTNAQARECGALLRDWYGEPKRTKGRDKWFVSILTWSSSDFEE